MLVRLNVKSRRRRGKLPERSRMEVMIATDGGSRWGQVDLTTPSESCRAVQLQPGHPIQVQGPRYIWRPATAAGRRSAEPLSTCHRLPVAQPNGRFFVPAGGFDEASEFAVRAASAGHAILQQTGNLSVEAVSSYRIMSLLFQQSCRLREALVRVFHRIEDLYIPTPARFEPSENDILPAALNGDCTGSEGRLTVGELVAMGRRRAAESGITSPNESDLIRLGLLEVAFRNPIPLEYCTEEQARSLIRMALFDLGPASEPIDEAVIAEVQGRLIDAIGKHLGDPSEEFNRWFFENCDNIVHQIAKRKRPGGPIDREIVRQALLETVFRAFRYVGDALHVAMRAFADALPERLDEQEQAAFDAIYQRRSWLGNLPLLLLHRQFPVIQEIAVEILNHPADERLPGVLLRMLQLHSEMVANKRASERRYKRNSQHRNSEGRIAVLGALDKNVVAAGQRDELPLEIAREICERRRLGCDCRTMVDWHAELESTRSQRDGIATHSLLQFLQLASDHSNRPCGVGRTGLGVEKRPVAFCWRPLRKAGDRPLARLLAVRAALPIAPQAVGRRLAQMPTARASAGFHRVQIGVGKYRLFG